MKTSSNGLALIKKFEGCKLTAYKCVSTEKYYTIGYGHYGSDVTAGMTITHAQAEAYLKSDLTKFENCVNVLHLSLTQNMFDALVSFTYNCGNANLKKLVANRTVLQIADALLLYNKSGGKVLAGLTKRRRAERELFLTGYSSVSASVDYTTIAQEVIEGKWGNGSERKKKLTAMGYDCSKVQEIVNKLLKG